MTQHTCQSCEKMNPMGMSSNPLPCCATSNCIKTQNANPKICNTNPKNEHDYHEMSVSQQNIMTHHDMSCETYFHAQQPN